MDIKNCSKKEINEFLTLFMEQCYHEGEYNEEIDTFCCVKCGDTVCNNHNFFNLASFSILKTWMEKEKPELWKNYLKWCVVKESFKGKDIDYSAVFNDQINPRNLVEFLLHGLVLKDWGYKQCFECNGKGYTTKVWSKNDVENIDCDYCNRSGMVEHLALQYANLR